MHPAWGKKPDTKVYTLNDLIYMALEKAKILRQKMGKSVSRAGGGEGLEYKGAFWDGGAVLFLEYGGGHTTMCVCPNRETCTLESMSSRVCKIYFNKPD